MLWKRVVSYVHELKTNFSSYHEFKSVKGGIFRAPILVAKKWPSIDEMMYQSFIFILVKEIMYPFGMIFELRFNLYNH